MFGIEQGWLRLLCTKPHILHLSLAFGVACTWRVLYSLMGICNFFEPFRAFVAFAAKALPVRIAQRGRRRS